MSNSEGAIRKAVEEAAFSHGGNSGGDNGSSSSASAAAAQKWASTRRDLWAAMFDPVAAFTSADAERQAARAEDSVFALDSSGGTGQNLLTRTLSRASSTVYYVL